MKKFSVGVLAFVALLTSGAFAETLSVKMLDGENWWGGANCFGSQMPFTQKTALVIDLTKSGFANQYASMLISDKGRVVWCNDQTVLTITNGTIKFKSSK